MATTGDGAADVEGEEDGTTRVACCTGCCCCCTDCCGFIVTEGATLRTTLSGVTTVPEAAVAAVEVLVATTAETGTVAVDVGPLTDTCCSNGCCCCSC